MSTHCERCQFPTQYDDDRYCRRCVLVIRQHMVASGYLQPTPRARRYRPLSMRENTYETKHGVD